MAKPSLMGALADSAPDSSPDAAGGPDDDSTAKDPGVQAAQSVLDAVQDGDAESLFDALSAFCDMHMSKSDGMGGPDHKPKLVIAIGHGPSK
jgi:hypothetical protein